MKNYQCTCGNTVYFENTHCIKCGRTLGLDITSDRMLALDEDSPGIYFSADAGKVSLCRNYTDFNVCNGISHDNSQYCYSCLLNITVPNLSYEENITKWRVLENAKRRLIRTLLQLNLPLQQKNGETKKLSFRFMEDQQSNPDIAQEFVLTGHKDGVITINLREADDASRELTRTIMRELYRTPLGHLRHESGHYYFDILVKNSTYIEQFRILFGDENTDYQRALSYYYSHGPNTDTGDEFISHYAQAHPLEDWAECWAHYLHMMDLLETAATYDMLDISDHFKNPNAFLEEWTRLTIILNELNRSIGLNDAYPFTHSHTIASKLNFIHSVVDPTFSTIP